MTEDYYAQRAAEEQELILLNSRNRATSEKVLIPVDEKVIAGRKYDLKIDQNRVNKGIQKLNYNPVLVAMARDKSYHPGLYLSNNVDELNLAYESLYNAQQRLNDTTCEGLNCIATATSNHPIKKGHYVTGNLTFYANPGKYGWKRVPREEARPGSLVQLTSGIIPYHAMILDKKEGEKDYYNYSSGIHPFYKTHTPNWKPISENVYYNFVGNAADSLRWKVQKKLLGGQIIDYIGLLENPNKIGLKDGIWRPPTDGKRFDTNLIGMGLDMRKEHNPIVYNFLKAKGRLNNPYLTVDEERDLRMKTWQTKKPILDSFLEGRNLSKRGIITAAGMLWHGDPFKKMKDPSTVTGKALKNDRDLIFTFDAYYRHPFNREKYKSRYDTNEKYWESEISNNVEVPVNIQVKRNVKFSIPLPVMIPDGYVKVNYVNDRVTRDVIKNMKIRKKFLDFTKQLYWKPALITGFQETTNPGGVPFMFAEGGNIYDDTTENSQQMRRPVTTGGVGYIPDNFGQGAIDYIRKKLYDNILPWGYNNIPQRIYNAVVKNKKEDETRDRAIRDDLFATYLQIPNSEKHK